MKRKYYILGLLAVLCLLGTGYYAWTLYDAYRKQVAEWNESAKAVFEEALWMEVNKRAEVPIFSSSSGEHGMTTLKERIPDSVSVMTLEGFRKYKIDRDKYENSLVKETRNRAGLSTLFSLYPLSVDTLTMCWNRLLSVKKILVNSKIRYIHTDLELRNDTICSKVDGHLRFDSLTVSYLGFRCEHEVVAFVSYPCWLFALSCGNFCMLLFPWILLVLLFVCYPQLEEWVMQKLTCEKVIEKTVEVEKEIHVVDIQINQVGIFNLPDGTIFDSFAGTLTRDGVRQRLQPQSVSLLKLFLSKEDCQFTSDEICMKLWGDTSLSYRLHSAISRLRNDLKAVKSKLIVTCSYGCYELKSPISSKSSEN